MFDCHYARKIRFASRVCYGMPVFTKEIGRWKCSTRKELRCNAVGYGSSKMKAYREWELSVEQWQINQLKLPNYFGSTSE